MRKKLSFVVGVISLTLLSLTTSCSDEPIVNATDLQEKDVHKSISISVNKTNEMMLFEKAVRDMQVEMNRPTKDIEQIKRNFTIVLTDYLTLHKVSYSGTEGNTLFKLALDTHQQEILKLNPKLK